METCGARWAGNLMDYLTYIKGIGQEEKGKMVKELRKTPQARDYYRLVDIEYQIWEKYLDESKAERKRLEKKGKRAKTEGYKVMDAEKTLGKEFEKYNGKYMIQKIKK